VALAGFFSKAGGRRLSVCAPLLLGRVLGRGSVVAAGVDTWHETRLGELLPILQSLPLLSVVGLHVRSVLHLPLRKEARIVEVDRVDHLVFLGSDLAKLGDVAVKVWVVEDQTLGCQIQKVFELASRHVFVVEVLAGQQTPVALLLGSESALLSVDVLLEIVLVVGL